MAREPGYGGKPVDPDEKEATLEPGQQLPEVVTGVPAPVGEEVPNPATNEAEIPSGPVKAEFPSPERERAEKLQVVTMWAECLKQAAETVRASDDVDANIEDADDFEDVAAGADRLLAIMNGEDGWMQSGETPARFFSRVGVRPNGSMLVPRAIKKTRMGNMLRGYISSRFDDYGIVPRNMSEAANIVNTLAESGWAMDDIIEEEKKRKGIVGEGVEYEARRSKIDSSIARLWRDEKASIEKLGQILKQLSPNTKAALREDVEYSLAFELYRSLQNMTAEELETELHDTLADKSQKEVKDKAKSLVTNNAKGGERGSEGWRVLQGFHWAGVSLRRL
jgi:hypothetical protein